MKRQTPHDPTRREFLLASALAIGVPSSLSVAEVARAVERMSRLTPRPPDVVIVQFSDAGVREARVRVPKIVKPESEWKQQLTPLAFAVTRHAATERPFSGAYWNLHEKGLFRCICCDTALFSSAAKFDSGTGWPSFWQPIAQENVVGPRAQSPGADETEVTCHRCDAHLGDIFDDGPRPTGLRYCIDSVALRFVKAP
jgi:peptide-methionine (R)-S-oxide reductase